MRPSWVPNLVNHFEAFQSGGSVTCRLSDVSRDDPLAQRLLHLVQICVADLGQGRLQPGLCLLAWSRSGPGRR
jgi:hypothetical protein